MVEKEYGFVTLATGDDFYYKSAYKMLQSYRYQGGKYRFCIICDRENKFTRNFDDVVLLEKCKSDYRDKFELLKKAPYKKNIFIEPDCLIYRNIDDFWPFFETATAISAFGYNSGDLGIWFKNKELIQNEFEVEEIPIFNPGYLYIEKNETCNRCYNDLVRISEIMSSDNRFFSEDKLFIGNKLRDDPVFCIAMERNGCECAVEQKTGKCISLPSVIRFTKLKMSESGFDVVYNLNGSTIMLKDCYILHFSSRRLKEWLYFQQALAVSCLSKKRLSWCAIIVESRCFGRIVKKIFKIKSEVNSLIKKIKANNFAI